MQYDLVVIGSGPGGQRAALQGAKAGKKVAIVEAYPAVGGGCVHFGTLPSKSFRESVYRWSLGSRGALGKEVRQTSSSESGLPDVTRLTKRKDRVVATEAKVVFDQLKRNGIRVVYGKARFVSPNEVEVTGTKGKERLKSSFVFVATGARPVAPDNIPVDGEYVFDSDTILGIKKMPETLVVLGAGVIGCEYASMFSMAGCKVILVDKRDEVLASVDREIVDHLVDRYKESGMELELKCDTRKIELKKENGKARLFLPSGKTLEADAALVAMGRVGNTEGLGLDEIGLEPDSRGLIKVDRNFRTELPSIYAVGDVIGFPALAATAMEQGRLATCHAFDLDTEASRKFPEYFPFGIYTIPEISTVGKTEEEVKAEGIDYVAGKGRYKELARGQIVGDKWGLLKMVVERKTLKVLGVHIVGDNAADLVHIGQAVMALGGNATYFINNVFNYPTLAEAYKTAAFHAINQIHGTTTSK